MGQLMKYLVIVLKCMVINLALQAQAVRSVKATQEGQKIAIAYELVCTQPTEINLFLSEDNGQTWNALKTGVSGDVGVKVTQGSKVIYWDVLQSKEKLVGSAFVFKVKVKDQKKDENQINDIKSVKIGEQIWMAENLNVDHYRNGDPIMEVKNIENWSNLISGAWCYYDNEDLNGLQYGKLYNWFAISDKRGLCPTGWHVPSNEDWLVLENQLGGRLVAGKSLKSRHGWSGLESENTNLSDFSGLPGGGRLLGGNFYANGRFGFWWSSTEYDFSRIWGRRLNYDDSSVYRDNDVYKYFGLSVRCIKD
jgi:uncharacterized protein (TIGR02145 family)